MTEQIKEILLAFGSVMGTLSIIFTLAYTWQRYPVQKTLDRINSETLALELAEKYERRVKDVEEKYEIAINKIEVLNKQLENMQKRKVIVNMAFEFDQAPAILEYLWK